MPVWTGWLAGGASPAAEDGENGRESIEAKALRPREKTGREVGRGEYSKIVEKYWRGCHIDSLRNLGRRRQPGALMVWVGWSLVH